MVPDGFGFHLRASEYTWVTLVFESKDEAEAAHSHAAKAVAQAKALKIVQPLSRLNGFLRRSRDGIC